MDLSKDLVSQFAKITNDKERNKNSEVTVYGVAVKENDKQYVRLDGSNILTPIETTVDINEGDRLTILLKNHTAVAIGNLTSPSASSTKVNSMNSDLSNVKDTINGLPAISDIDINEWNTTTELINDWKVEENGAYVVKGEKIQTNSITTNHLTVELTALINGLLTRIEELEGRVDELENK